MRGKDPDFFCIGFQKSGTTTLYELVRQRRDVVLCRDIKEPMYYRVKGLRALGGKRFYRWRYFGHVTENDKRLCGEINAGLAFTGCARKLCRDFSPETKLIFMMRNPVDRAYSSYRYFLARGFLPVHTVRDDMKRGHAKAFDRYVHEILDHPARRRQIMKKRLKYLVFSQSSYGTSIQEFMGHFKNRKFILFEDFIRNEKQGCREIDEFLGLAFDETIDYTVRVNEGSERAVSPWRSKCLLIAKGCKHILREFVYMQHWAPRLYEHFLHFYGKIRGACLAPDYDKSEVLPGTREYLEQYFAGEVGMVEQLLGRDLSGIWYDLPDRGTGHDL